MNITSETTPFITTAVQGTTSAMLLFYYRQMLNDSIIWLIAAGILIIADLYFGIDAAIYNGEKVRVSRAVRRTLNKICEYFCWIMMSAVLSVCYHSDWIKLAILSVVIGNELQSCITNFFAARGVNISFNIFKMLAKVTNNNYLEDITITKKNKNEDEIKQ